MGHNVLKAYHQMIGCDPVHDLWVPGSPSPGGIAPYGVGFPVLTGATFATAKWGETVADQQSWTMIRGTDIGPLIPHVGPPNLYWPVMLLLSGSKSHFASSSVDVEEEGQYAAVAVAWIVNTNLNCCGPLKCIPLPFGLVITHNTVEANFTFADFMAGLASMAVDAVLEFAINWIFFGIGKIGPVSRLSQRVYERFIYRGLDRALGRIFPAGASGLRARLGNRLFQRHNLTDALFLGLGHQFPLTFASLVGGSPVGLALPPSPGAGGLGVGDAMAAGYEAVHNYYDTPGVDEHPSSTPDSGPTGDHGTDTGGTSGPGGQDGGTGSTGPEAGDANTGIQPGGEDVGAGTTDTGTSASTTGTGDGGVPDAGPNDGGLPPGGL